MTHDEQSELAQSVLRRLVLREGVRQAFVFNSEGDPFWAGKRPITPEEAELLEVAAALIVDAEKTLEKPFLALDEQHRFSAAALEEDTDLYLVLLHGPAANEARLQAARVEAAQALRPIRNPGLRLASSP
jgi:hypothetical protein